MPRVHARRRVTQVLNALRTPGAAAAPVQLAAIPEQNALIAAIEKLTAGQQQLTAGQLQLTAAVESMRPLLEEASQTRRKRLNPWRSTNRTVTEQSQFKESLLTHYSRTAPTTEDKKPQVRCMVSDVVLPRPVVIASHIWKHCTMGEGLNEFGLKPADVDSCRNGLLLAMEIERHFDVLRVAFSYNLLTDQFTFHVLDATLLPLPIVDLKDKQTKNRLSAYPPLEEVPTFKALDGKVMQWTAPALPFRRLLAWHYALAVSKKLRSASALAPTPSEPRAAPFPAHVVKSPGWDKRSPEAKWPDSAAMDLYDHAASRSDRDDSVDDAG